MRPRNWDKNRWLEFLDGASVPAALLSDFAQRHIGFDFLDLSIVDNLQNAVCARCELSGGTVLSAEEAGFISGAGRGLGVIGVGPTAVIAVATAVLRGIHVTWIRPPGARLMAPLAGARHRWICPNFYAHALGHTGGPPPDWHLQLDAFPESELSELYRRLRVFKYHEQPAGEVAEAWIQAITDLLSEYATAVSVVEQSEPWSGDAEADLNRLDELLGGGGPVGLVLLCRFADGEKLTLMRDDRVVEYTSFPYWETRDQERWMEPNRRILISGGGDGALQDFLRAVWRWSDLSAGLKIYETLFPRVAMPRVREVSRRADSISSDLYRVWDDYLRAWLIYYAEPSAEAEARLASETKDKRLASERTHVAMLELATDLARLVQYRQEAVPIVYLHTRSRLFGPCYAHNHLFGLLTVLLHAAKWYVDPEGPKIHFDSPSEVDRSDPEACVVDVAAEGGDASRKSLGFRWTETAPGYRHFRSIPVDLVLLRYGPYRREALRWRRSPPPGVQG